MPDEITGLLRSWRAGDLQARESLFDAVYAALHEMAQARLDAGDAGLSPTALVHEALLRLLGREAGAEDRAHFFALVSLKMRELLVEFARARLDGRLGTTTAGITMALAGADGTDDLEAGDVLALDRALEQLCGHDPRAGRAVELAYFGGMSQDEIATVLGVPAETVDRDLRFARAWLNRTLAG